MTELDNDEGRNRSKMPYSRRNLLRGIGAAGALGSIGPGVVAAKNANRYIVGTRPGRADVARGEATRVEKTLRFGTVGHAVVGEWPEQALEGLRRNPHIRYIEEDFEMHGDAQEIPWGVGRVGARVVNAAGTTGETIHVAILDSGIRSNHPDLEGNLGEGHALAACDPDLGMGPCEEDWDDDSGHGTHVAGIVGALDNDIQVVGVAPEVILHAVKVLNHTDDGLVSDIAAGIEIAVDAGYDVANMSLSSTRQSEIVRDAVRYADEEGMVIVASTGNDGSLARCDGNDCVGYPAAEPETIAVSNTTRDDTIAANSSTGPEVDIAAPGSRVLSTTRDGGTGTNSGTSMAAPHVAGAVALLLANGTPPESVRDVLRDTAEDIGLQDVEQGVGLLAVANAFGHGFFPRPEAAFTYAPDPPNENEEVQFDAGISTPQDTIETYEWDFNVSQLENAVFVAAGPTPTHTFELGDRGSYFVALRVTDTSGQTDITQQFFHINAAPTASFEFAPDPPLRNEPVVFDAADSAANGGFIASYEWDFGDGSAPTTSTDPVIEHRFEDGGETTVTLRVTDDNGASDDEISVMSRTFSVQIAATVAIKPGSNGTNAINLRNEGNVPVAVVQTEDFDSTVELDPDTVRLGASTTVNGGGGAAPAHGGGHTEDVNNNGTDDWLCHFPVSDTGFARGDEEGTLVAETTDGVPVVGSDEVRIVGRP